MKKSISKILCAFLAFVMVLVMCAPAFAKSVKYPVVMVPGMTNTTLYTDVGTDSEKEAFGIDALSILSDEDLIDELDNVLDAKDVDTDKLISALSQVANQFKTLSYTSDGEPAYNLGVKDWNGSKDTYLSGNTNEQAILRQIADEVGKDNVYILSYNWESDVCDSADRLNTLIQSVKSETGASQVTLISGSLGTSVVSAYLDAYGSQKDVHRSVFLDGALQGVSVTRAFSQDLHIDKNGLLTYLKTFSSIYSGSVDMSLIYRLINDTDFLTNLCNYLNKVIADKDQLNRVYNEVILPVIGNCPAYWECIPYKDFDACVNKIVEIGGLSKNSGLYQKISHYHEVQGRCRDNIKKFEKNGGEAVVFASYGMPTIPITSQKGKHSDNLIDTDYESVGATVAKFGKTLGANKYGSKVSGDRVVDASTCLLPDSTWFVKNVMHMAYNYNTQATKFLAKVTTMDAKPTISSVKEATKYGQFLTADKKQNLKDLGTATKMKAGKINSVVSAKDKKATLTLKKVTGAGSYRVAYRKAGAKKYSYVTSSKTKVTIKGLKSGALYEFKYQAIGKKGSKYVDSNYSGTAYRYIKQINAGSVKAGRKKANVKWSKDSAASGYEIYYSTGKNVNKASHVKAGKGSTSKTIKNLKSGKTYNIWVRSYKNSNGKKYNGEFSKVKTVKVK